MEYSPRENKSKLQRLVLYIVCVYMYALYNKIYINAKTVAGRSISLCCYGRTLNRKNDT